MFYLLLFLCCVLLGYLGYWSHRSAIYRIPVKGELAGQKISTTVDSEFAKYYLENYLQNNRMNPELDSKIDRILQAPKSTLPDRAYLKNLSSVFSVDFSALYLAKHLLEYNSNNGVKDTFFKELSKQKIAVKTGNYKLHSESSSYVFLLVPGWIYKSETDSGADLARPREVITKLGLKNHLIEIDEDGTIEQNAACIAKEILYYSNLKRKIVIISVSKGGAEVAQALGSLLGARQTRNVKAWVNIGGILQGSLLADSIIRWPRRLLLRLFCLFNGWKIASIESMATQGSRVRFSGLNIPKEIVIINFVGIPLSGDITERARKGYLELRTEGPNDGLTLITDAIAPNSTTIFEIGLDHFFLHPQIDLKTAGLLIALINYLESQNLRKL